MTADVSRILVIDDDPGSLETTRVQLIPDGHETILETSGVAALRWLDLHPTDVVVCDVMMPELDGFAFCRRVKQHIEWRFVPVILLTALGDGDSTIRGLDAGADDFVTKPVEGAVLRARVRAMLRVREQYAGLRQRTRAPTMERRTDLIQRAQLTGREQEVLELLLLGRTHEDIATMLGITERTSKFHQANLLAKLGAESRHDLLRLFL